MDTKTISELVSPLPIHTKPGPGGTKYRFVKGEEVIDRLNTAFSYEWSSEVLYTDKMDDFVVVRVRLTVAGVGGPVYKEGFGSAQIMKNNTTGKIIDLGNVYKSAFTSGLKKAAEQFGIGLKQEEGVEEAAKPKAAPPRRDAYPSSPPTNSAHQPPPKPVPAASESVVMTVKKPDPAPESVEVADDDELERAEQILRQASGRASNPPPTERPREAAPETPKAPPASFPKSEAVAAADAISDIQLAALEKLCATTKKNLTTLVMDAVKDGALPDSKKDVPLKELSRLDGAVLVRYLSTRISAK